jgi:HD superfamily phosphohydrolase YqeK
MKAGVMQMWSEKEIEVYLSTHLNKQRFEHSLRVRDTSIDLAAHYNLMLCYQGLQNKELAHREQLLYARFKADEASQTITGPYRQLHPDDNNERQPIHEHVSAKIQ